MGEREKKSKVPTEIIPPYGEKAAGPVTHNFIVSLYKYKIIERLNESYLKGQGPLYCLSSTACIYCVYNLSEYFCFPYKIKVTTNILPLTPVLC